MTITPHPPLPPECAPPVPHRPPPLITVAICTRNRAALLRVAAGSVLNELTDDTELLIVDNASSDDTSLVVLELAGACSRVTAWRETEIGLSAARNTALARARGEYVLFLDDDATPGPGWLSAYTRFLSDPPARRIACVGGPVFPRYEIHPPTWMDFLANTLNFDTQVRAMPEKGGPWGGNCAYHRETALRMGGFATELGHKGDSLGVHEESELNCRLQRAGFGIWWLPGAPIHHFIPARRLTLRWNWRSSFALGRSTATMRLRLMDGPRRRLQFRALRLAATPFHLLVCLAAALMTLPLHQRRASARYLLRSARIAGLAWQLLRR